MPVGAVRRLERDTDGVFDISPRVRASEPAPVVVERRLREARDLQQKG